MVALASSIALAQPTLDAPGPAPARSAVFLPRAGITVTMPDVAGWQVASDASNDGLYGQGTQVGVARETRTCAAWAAEPAPEALPEWAPTSFWPVAHAATDGKILCLQRDDAAFLVGLTVTGGSAPSADTRAVLLAVADALRPPLALTAPGTAATVMLRLPMPAHATAGTHVLTALAGSAHFTFQIFLLDGACDFGRTELEADDDTPEPWLHAHIAQDGRQSVCAEFGGHAVGLVWPLAQQPLRAQVMRALAAAGLAAFGPAVTNARGTLAIAGKDVALEPETAGRWKATVTGGATYLTSLDTVPFVVVVAPHAKCPAGDELLPERAQGFAPPALLPVHHSAPAGIAKLRLTSCLRDAVVEVRGLSRAAEPPSGTSAVHVRAALVAAVTALGLDPEVAAPHTAAHAPEVRERPEIETEYRSDVALWGGLLALTAPADSTHYGALAGGDLRAGPRSGFGIAATLEGRAGYGNGGQEEVRGGLGGGFGVGGIALQLVVGPRVGALGPEGTYGGFMQIGATLDLGRVIATAAALQEIIGSNSRRYDFHLAFAPGADRGTIVVGAQLGQLLDPAVGNSDTLVFYLGVGFTSAHDQRPE